MKFTNQLWDESEILFKEIIMHPFNQELMNGNLDIEKFKFYIHQDSIYLFAFSKALSLTAAKAENTKQLLQFLDYASDAIRVESLLHQEYFEKYAISLSNTPSPACFSYINYLLSTCSLCNIEEAIASLLPCFWVYREVGNYILQHASKNNKYQQWIETYSSKEFSNNVNQMLDITNQIADELTVKSLNKMKEKFIYSFQLEYMFWDSAYEQEKWI